MASENDIIVNTADAARKIEFISRREKRCAMFWFAATVPQLLAIVSVMLNMGRNSDIDAHVLVMFALICVIPALNIRNGIACLKRSKAADPKAAAARYGKTASDIRQVVYNCAAWLLRIVLAVITDNMLYDGDAITFFGFIVTAVYGPAIAASLYGLFSVLRFARLLNAGANVETGEAKIDFDREAEYGGIYKREKRRAAFWILAALPPALMLMNDSVQNLRFFGDAWPTLFLFGLSLFCIVMGLWGVMARLGSPTALAAWYEKKRTDEEKTKADSKRANYLVATQIVLSGMCAVVAMSLMTRDFALSIFIFVLSGPAVAAWFLSRRDRAWKNRAEPGKGYDIAMLIAAIFTLSMTAFLIIGTVVAIIDKYN